MTDRKFLTFSQIASQILASVSSNGGDGGGDSNGCASAGIIPPRSIVSNASPVFLRGKLDLSLWRESGNEDDDDDDDEDDETRKDRLDDGRAFSPSASPILAPLLATKKKPSYVNGYEHGNNNGNSNDLTAVAGLSPFGGQWEQEEDGSVSKYTAASVISLWRSKCGKITDDENDGNYAVVDGEGKPHERQLPPIIAQPQSPSQSSTASPTATTTTAALLSSFIGSFQLSSASQFESGKGEDRVRSGKKVEFCTMEEGHSGAKPQSASDKGKGNGRG